MAERVLRGAGASPGLAIGPMRVLDRPADREATSTQPWRAELERARAALDAARTALQETAARLRAEGWAAEAEIVDAGALMALDPALETSVAEAVRDRRRTAAAAVLEAADLHAARIAALEDPRLAERAADVRSLGRRAARIAAGWGERGGSSAGTVVVAKDLGPADVADLDDGVAAIALAQGGTTAHAAIVARSLGVPMAAGLGRYLLALADGTEIVVDGTCGEAVVRPSPELAARARAAMHRRLAALRTASAGRELPATTRDGRELRVLVNAAGPAEVRAGLAAGAAGIGLLRTELAFLDAAAWPSREQHRRSLEPVLGALGAGRPATVRLLDFGGDKTPPFLRGTGDRGIALLLAAPEALRAQLGAIAGLPDRSRLRVLLPMVERVEQVDAVRRELDAAVDVAGGGRVPGVAAMIETPAAAAVARDLAARSDALSIGTNDLAHAALGTDRFASGEATTHHPAVLSLVADVVAAAHAAGVPVEVCGEAASDPVALPLLVGLGIDELSVGAARVGTVRRWVRAIDFERAGRAAEKALRRGGAQSVAALVRRDPELSLLEAGDAADEPVDRARRFGAVGTQP